MVQWQDTTSGRWKTRFDSEEPAPSAFAAPFFSQNEGMVNALCDAWSAARPHVGTLCGLDTNVDVSACDSTASLAARPCDFLHRCTSNEEASFVLEDGGRFTALSCRLDTIRLALLCGAVLVAALASSVLIVRVLSGPPRTAPSAYGFTAPPATLVPPT